MRGQTPVHLLALSLLLGCDAYMAAQAQQEQAPPAGNVAAEAVAVGETKVAVAVAVADVKADTPAAQASADVDVQIKPEALDLESITFLVKKGKVKDGPTLEKKINNPKEKLNNVDIDGDGKIDKIVIVETKKDDGVILFELKAIPSKSKDKDAAVVIAVIDFTPDKTTKVLVVKAHYAPVVIGHETIVYDYSTPIVVENDVIVVSSGGGFHGWLYTAHRPAYYGVVIYEAPPPPVFVFEVGFHGHHDHHDHHGPHGHHGHHGKHGKHGKH